jgi:hypothetical protein
MPGDVDTASSCAIAARVTQAQATVQAALAAISAERREKAAEEKQSPLSIHRATTAAKSLSAHSSLTSPLVTTVADASATGTMREDVERCVRGEWELFEAETSLRLQLGRCAEHVLRGFTARPPLPTQLIEQVRLRTAEQGELRARVERLGIARVEEQRRLCSAEAGRLEQHERRVSELSQQLSRARADRDVVSAEVGRLQREEARRERAEEVTPFISALRPCFLWLWVGGMNTHTARSPGFGRRWKALRQQQAELARSEAELQGLGARAHELAARQVPRTTHTVPSVLRPRPGATRAPLSLSPSLSLSLSSLVAVVSSSPFGVDTVVRVVCVGRARPTSRGRGCAPPWPPRRSALAASSPRCRCTAVSRAFPSWKQSMLTEIYLCHACSCHEVEDGNARAGDSGAATEALCALAATSPSSREDPSAVPEEQGRAAVSRSCACIGSPCLRRCGHGVSTGGGGARAHGRGQGGGALG